MRLLALTLTLILGATSAHAECRIPSRSNEVKKTQEYRVRQGDTLCLSNGGKLVARKVAKNAVTFRVKGIKGESSKRLASNGSKSAKVLPYRLKLKGSSQSRASSAIVVVEVAELDIKVYGPFPGPTPPRACAQMVGVCTTEYKPVCGIDLNGDIKEYSNACQAAADCAEVVEQTLC